jgi:hypothetical protein
LFERDKRQMVKQRNSKLQKKAITEQIMKPRKKSKTESRMKELIKMKPDDCVICLLCTGNTCICMCDCHCLFCGNDKSDHTVKCPYKCFCKDVCRHCAQCNGYCACTPCDEDEHECVFCVKCFHCTRICNGDPC